MTRPVKLLIVAAVLVLLPLLVSIQFIKSAEQNGVLTAYSFFDLGAVLLGLIGIVVAINAMRIDPTTAHRPPRWVVGVCVVVLLVGVLQIVRGFGVFPGLTGCVSKGTSFGICTPAPLHKAPEA